MTACEVKEGIMEKTKVEICDKIQILTRAMSIAQVTTENVLGQVLVKTIPSVDDVINNYRKLLKALTEESSE
jgi:hypothetical protein